VGRQQGYHTSRLIRVPRRLILYLDHLVQVWPAFRPGPSLALSLPAHLPILYTLRSSAPWFHTVPPPMAHAPGAMPSLADTFGAAYVGSSINLMYALYPNFTSEADASVLLVRCAVRTAVGSARRGANTDVFVFHLGCTALRRCRSVVVDLFYLRFRFHLHLQLYFRFHFLSLTVIGKETDHSI
jgi:hypothetical protein